jgi:transposase
MWTPTTRQQHSRPLTRYQTDLTDAEWRVIAPHLPKPCATGRLTRVAHARDRQRDILRDGAGCPWRLLPKDLPRWGTIYRWFAAWRDDGRFERMNHALMMADRERVGRDATPRRRSSTAKASRPPRPAARPVTMRARKNGHRGLPFFNFSSQHQRGGQHEHSIRGYSTQDLARSNNTRRRVRAQIGVTGWSSIDRASLEGGRAYVARERAITQ